MMQDTISNTVLGIHNADCGLSCECVCVTSHQRITGPNYAVPS